MKILEAFLPMDRRQAFARNQAIPSRMTGTLLFADISGFTTLMGSYIQDLGQQRGTEELSQQLDLFFDTLITHLYLYKGSVISFSGDAITCWFRNDDGHRALAASHSIQEAIRLFASITTSAGTVVSIKLKISIVHGTISRFIIGDPNISKFDVITGIAVNRLAFADKVSIQGKILVDKAIQDHCKGDLVIEEWRKTPSGEQFGVVKEFLKSVPPDPWEKIEPIPSSVLRPWILPTIFERLSEGHERFLTELRPGVVSFISFKMDYVDEKGKGLRKLDRFIRYVQQETVKQGGNVLQVTFGDKGNIIFMGFGAPVSHEDDIDRALETINSIHNLPKELNYVGSIKAGISQGYLRTGYYGGKNRCNYTFLGEHTNLAARLMNKALPGQTLASQPIQNGTKKFDFIPLGALLLKGFVNPMSIFEIRGKKITVGTGSETVNTITINRSKEKMELSDHLEKVSTHLTSKCFLLESEAGLGKTNLIQWLIKKAQAANMKVLLGRADAIEKRVPYHSLVPVLKTIFQIGIVNETESLLKWRIRSTLNEINPQLLQWIPLLNAVLPIRWEETDEIHALNGEDRAKKLLWLLKEVFQNYGRKHSVLLVLENAQWIDDSTWTFLVDMLETASRFFLVLPIRSNETFQPQYLKIKAASASQTIRMKALSKEAINKILSNYFSFSDIDTSILDLLFQKTGGNPLYSIEFVNFLLEKNILTIEEKQCKPASATLDFKRISLPDNIHGVILNRIDQLSSRQQLVLKVASILGQSFTFYYFQTIYPVLEERPILSQVLDDLVTSNLIKKEFSEEGIVYHFQHHIVQEVVYGLIPFKLRKQLHLKLVHWLEEEYKADLTPFQPLLGHHSEAAENWHEASKYWGGVGEKASHNGAYTEAEKNFNHAIKLLAQLPEKQTTLKQLLDLKLMLGAVWIAIRGQSADEVKTVYLEAWEISQRIQEDIPELASVFFGFSVSYFVKGEMDIAIRMANDALVVAQRTASQQLQIQAHLMLGNSYFWIGDFTASERHFELLSSLYDPREDKQHITKYAQNPMITGLTCNTWLKCLVGNVDQAIAQCEKAINLAESLGHSFSIAIAYQIKAWLYQHLQNPLIAGEMAQRLIELSQKEGFPIYENIGRAILGWSIAKTGDPDKGIKEIRAVILKWKEMKARLGLGFFYMQLGEACAAGKKWELGIQVLDEAEEGLRYSQEQAYLPALYLLRGQFLFQLEGRQYRKSKYWLRRSLQLSQQQNNYHFALRAATYLATILNLEEQPGAALDILDQVYSVDKYAPDQEKAKTLINELQNFSSP